MKTELFLDKSIVLSHSDNIKLEKNHAQFKQHVFSATNHSKGYYIVYFTIIKNKNTNYRLYYRETDLKGKKSTTSNENYCAEHECIYYAESVDGLNFEKKDCLSEKNKSLTKEYTHNFSPYYDYKHNKYIALSGTNRRAKGLYLFNSTDGLIWRRDKKIFDDKMILPGWYHVNHFDSQNCILYNELDKKYYVYMRDNKNTPFKRRFVQFSTTSDLNKYEKPLNIKISNMNVKDYEFYTFYPFIYKECFLSIPTFGLANYKDFLNMNGKHVNKLLYSKNGHEWSVINENFFPQLKNEAFSVLNYANSVNGKEIYFYINNYNLEENIQNYIDCYSIGKDRFTKLICKGNERGFIKTKLINLTNNKILINYESTGEKGSVQVILKDKDDNIIFKSLKYTGNEIDKSICWETNDKSFIPGNYFIEFKLFDCILYSFSYNV